jgi:integrase
VVPLTVEAVQAIADHMGARYAPMVPFAAATGMRGGEIRGLTWDRVDLKAGLVTIDRQMVAESALKPVWGPPKTSSGRRRITIGPETVALLESLPRDGAAGLVFTTPQRTLITRRRSTAVWDATRTRVMQAANVDAGDGWHQLRHFHASLLIAGGMSPVAVAHRLGHKDAIETLRTYAHLFSHEDERSAAISDGVVRLSSEHGDSTPET